MDMPKSKGKLHQAGIEHERHEEVERDDGAQWPYGDEVCDLVGIRDHVAKRAHAREDNHAGDHEDAEAEGEFELAEDGGDLVEESRLDLFLGGRAP